MNEVDRVLASRRYVDSILNPYGYIHSFKFYVDGQELPAPSFWDTDTLRGIVSKHLEALGPHEYLYVRRPQNG